MATTPSPSSSTQSTQPTNPPPPPHRNAIYFHSFPSIKILKPPKGRYSPRVDERCITYCTQSIRGRIEQTEPWCRSFCIRRVFEHEVKKTLAFHGDEPNAAVHKATPDAKYPLPPEGQPAPDTSQRPPQSSEGQEWEEEFQWTPSVSLNRPGKEDQRVWKAGWYLWVSKSRWAAQEKMDLMMCDLAKQAEWQKYKERMNADWAEYTRQTRSLGELAAEDIGTHDAHHQGAEQPAPMPQPQIPVPSAAQGPIAGELSTPLQSGPPFPDIASQSILLPVPPPLTFIEVPLRNLFAPTEKLLTVTHQTISSGQQTRFLQKLFEKAQTDEPYKLARNAVMKVWQAFKENTDSGSGSGSGGNDEKGRDRNS